LVKLLGWCNIIDKGAEELGKLLGNSKVIKRICLFGNDLTENGIFALANGFLSLMKDRQLIWEDHNVKSMIELEEEDKEKFNEYIDRKFKSSPTKSTK